MMNRKLISSVVAGLLTVGLVGVAGTAFAGDKHDHSSDAAKKGVSVGDAAPDFTLTGADGKSYTLSEWTKKGNIVVLEWFNSECPFCVKHGKDGTIKQIVSDYKDKNVVVLGINSGAKGKQGHGKDAEAIKAWDLNYTVLNDETGKTGKAYGAKTTPHMYIIGKDGKVAYMGAIDDQKEGGKNYVRQALDQIIKGETVTEASTKPYGCSVKYGA